MIVWGGYSGSSGYGSKPLNTGGRFNPATGTWSPISDKQAPSARYEHFAVWRGEEMIVWGGLDGTKGPRSGGRYRPADDTWVPGATNGAPDFASRDDAVWTGEGMLVYNEKLSAYYEPGFYSWDGIPNNWQRHYFGENNSEALPLEDPDADGQNNWQEYVAGTNPTNAEPSLILGIHQAPGQLRRFEIIFSPRFDGRNYTLLYIAS